MRSVNPSTKIVPSWSWAGVGGLLLMLVVAVLAPRQRSFEVVSGLVTLGLFLVSAAYVVRKRLFLSSFGTLHAWMVGHIVLGALVIVAMVIHGGVTQVGTQGLLLYALAIVEFGSGQWGVYELKATPRRFSKLAGNSHLYPSAARARIRLLLLSLERDLERRKSEFREWFEKRYGSVVRAESDKLPTLEGYPKGRERHASKLFATLEELVSVRATRDRLEAVERQSRRWLYLHVPTAVALIVLVVLHIAARIYY